MAFPEAYILPIGSVKNIATLNQLSKELQSSIFGIDFFMIRDRDGLSPDQIAKIEENPRFRCLRRRHVENYFLDSGVLATVASRLYLDDKWHDADTVLARLKEICDRLLPLAVALHMKHFITVNGTIPAPPITDASSKALDTVKSDIIAAVSGSLGELGSSMATTQIEREFDREISRLEKSLSNNAWKLIFPGKVIFGTICSDFGVSSNRVRRAYLDLALRDKPAVFSEITKIFEQFRSN
jgi:hypothetical protein